MSDMTDTRKQHESRADVERGTMGAILYDAARAMPLCIQAGCRADWFADRTLAAAYQLAEQSYGDGKPVDLLTIGAKAKRPSSIALLEECAAGAWTATNIGYYLEMLEQYATHAAALEMAEQARARLEKLHPLDAADQIDDIKASWESLGTRNMNKAPELYALAMDAIRQWTTPKTERPLRIQWPIQALNQIIGGLTDELVYVCAAESVGKTAFVLQFLIGNGKAGIRGAMASLESSAKRLVPRMLSQIAGLNTLEVDRGYYDQDDVAALQAAADALRNPGFAVADHPMTIEQLLAWGRLSVSRGAQYLVIDNTRHIQVRQRFGSPVEEMRYISLRLKRMRDELRVPLIALHHANDKGDVSWSKDLRWDVDVLLMMAHNADRSIVPVAGDGFRGRWYVDFSIEKNRDGRKGMTITSEFNKERQVFV
jgi:replicative DNA helicase